MPNSWIMPFKALFSPIWALSSFRPSLAKFFTIYLTCIILSYIFTESINYYLLKYSIMLLHEIIEINDELTDAILMEELYKYRNSLYTYYLDYFCSEPILMVVNVTNTCQYALIAPAGEYLEAMESFLGHEATAEESELIGFQSILLRDF